MKTVLFVDDEAAVLQGLRYALHGYRRRWNLVFLTSGTAALEALESTTFDLVVSDLKMPDIDGVELLTRVRSKQPAAVRIILSGNVEHVVEDGVAHEALRKPCAGPALRSCLERWLGP